MLSIHNLSKNFGIQPVLQNINFNISTGERIGLIGANGSGKTTLMRILAGLDHPDSGNVASTHPNLRTGYLAQGMDFQPEQTLHSALGIDSDSQTYPALEVESLARALSQHPNDPTLQAQYDKALARLSTFDLRPEAILAPLGLSTIPLDTPVAHLSGGQKTRLMLAKVLLEDPHLLLLDEPTNHLDIEMLEWLEDWLNRFHGAALIVSHDRMFLDNTVTAILELDSATHTIKAYDGNYSDYLEQKLLEFDKQSQVYQDQQDELAQLRRAARHIRNLTVMKKGGKADGGDKFAKGFFGNRATNEWRDAPRTSKPALTTCSPKRKSKSRMAHGNSNSISENLTINRKMSSSPIRSQLATRKVILY